MRIFINNIDDYMGQALCADLRSVLGQDNRLFGTVSTDTADAPPELSWEEKVDSRLMEDLGVKRVIRRDDQDKYFEDVLSCSLVVFDLHSSSPEDVEAILKHLKLAKLDHQITFILISSVQVWARTKTTEVKVVNEEDEGDEEAVPQFRPEVLVDAVRDRRTPSAEFEPWKYLEMLTLALGPKEKLRPHVVCAGILYGNGERTFNEIFKAAWLTQPTHVIMQNSRAGQIQPGTNYIPCVHVRDVARLVRVMASDTSVGSYLIAVDKARLTQADIVRGIVNQISHKRDIPVVQPGETSFPFADVMSLDLIMEPSPPMKSKGFDWWSKKGLVVNIEKVADEFCRWRNLRPIKTLVMGPPGSGAQALCARIAEQYLHEDPPHLTFNQILEDELKAGTESAAKLQARVDKAKKTPGGKLNLKIRTRLVERRLLSNVCRYRGYVLERYPTSFEEAEALFSENAPNPEGDVPEEEEGEPWEGEEEEEEAAPAPPADDEEEEPEVVKQLKKTIMPEFVIVLSSAEDRCKKRIFNGEVGFLGMEEDFLQQTLEYRKANLAEDGRAGSAEFFEEIGGVNVLRVDADSQSAADVFQVSRVYLESQGQFFNYLRSDEELLREEQEKIKKQEMEKEIKKEEQRQEVIAAEAELHRERELGEAGRRQIIADGEAQLLEDKSMDLRQYLKINVVPTLSQGLLEVCKTMPDDPVEYLAQYLFAHAQEIAPQLEAAARMQ